MTQIALAESGGRLDAVGDVSLQNATWGPSVGLYQIRTVKAETGRGTDRDILALTNDPARQAQAAYNISRRGIDFTPWTVFRTGAYQKFAATVADALRGIAGVAGGLVDAGAGVVSGLTGDVVGRSLSGARSLGLTALFVVAGLALLGVGAVQAAAPARAQARRLVTPGGLLS